MLDCAHLLASNIFSLLCCPVSPLLKISSIAAGLYMIIMLAYKVLVILFKDKQKQTKSATAHCQLQK